MDQVVNQVVKTLKTVFQTASNIYVDPEARECEVTISIDEYQGELKDFFVENGVQLKMIDYCDVYPFKYVFSFNLKDQIL
ncbi:MAG: hypothetical protein JW731_12425 [Bacteroidales bacterium]|nr:hypothetical protein [Bacteroidales bacterium]